MKRSFLLFFCFMLIGMMAIAQSTSWRGITNASWSVATNWTNGVPTAATDVIIGDAHFTGIHHPKVNVVSECKSVTVGTVVPVVLTISRHLTVNGNVTIASNGTISHPGTTIYLTGDWINNGTYQNTATSSRVIMQGGAQNIGGTQISVFRRLTINATSTVTLQNHIVADSTGSVLDVTGTINPGISPSYSVTSKVTTKLNPVSRILIYAPTFSENYNFSGRVTFYAGATAEYAASLHDQVISSAYSYSTLILSGGTTKSLVANLPLLYGKNNPNGRILVNDAIFNMGPYTANRAANVAGGEFFVANGSVVKLSGLNNFPINYATRNLSVNSLVEYNGADQTISPQVYGNLTVSGSGNKNALLASQVNGDFTINNVNWNTAATVVSHSFAGNITMNGGTISGTNSTYIFNGSGNQSVAITSPLLRMTVNKSAGMVQLASDLTISNNLSFIKGNIQTGNNNLFIPVAAGISGAGQSTGYVEGNLRMFYSTGASVSRTFDVGSGSTYSPVTIQLSSVTTAGFIQAATFTNDHSELDYSSINDNKSVNRYWSLQNISAAYSSAEAVFNWQSSDIDAGANTSIFKSGMYSGVAWTINSNTSPLPNSIKATGLSTLAEFAVGEKLSVSTWTGNMMTSDWNTPRNWHGGIPSADMDALIPTGLTGGRLYPVVSAGTVSVNSISVEASASLAVQNAIIQIAGSINNNGLFDVSDGTVEFNGTNPQTVPAGAFSGNIVQNLLINNQVSLADTDTLTGTLTIGHGKTFATNNHLVLKSTASGTARIHTMPVDGSGNATAFITGEVSIERHIPARKAWRLLSAPIANGQDVSINEAWQEGVNGQSFGPSNPNPGYGVHITGGTVQNGFDQSPTNSASVKIYQSNTNSFVGLPANPGTNAPINQYTGYMVYIRGDRSINLMAGNNAAVTATTLRMKGLVNTGRKTYNVQATGFTVLGNPYPSAIDFQTLSRTNVKNTFYIWDPKLSGSNGLGAYVTASWNSNTNSYDFTASASPVSQYIPSGEAVLIESVDGVNPGSISINESDKTSNGSDQMFGRPSSAGQKLNISLLAVEDGGPALMDAALATFSDMHSNDVDAHDAGKLPIDGPSIAILRNGKILSIERRSPVAEADTIQTNLQHCPSGKYIITLKPENMEASGVKAYIHDRYENVFVPVLMDGATEWPFKVSDEPASYAADRFMIVFGQMPVHQQQAETTLHISSPAITDMPVSPAIMVYPNPVTGNALVFRTTDLQSGLYKASLVNSMGQVVLTHMVQVTTGKSQSHSLELGGRVPAGRYELRLEGHVIKMSTTILRK